MHDLLWNMWKLIGRSVNFFLFIILIDTVRDGPDVGKA